MKRQTTLELNGFRHPVSAQVMLMTGEDAATYLKFTKTLAEEFQPATQLESQLAFSIADAQWRLNHIRALQNNMLSVQLVAAAGLTAVNVPAAQPAVLGAQVHPKNAPSLATLSIHEQRIHREFHKDLKTLRELQAERRKLEEHELDQAAKLLQLEKSKAKPGRALNYRPADDGFSFPIEKVEWRLRTADRRREAFNLQPTHKAAA